MGECVPAERPGRETVIVAEDAAVTLVVFHLDELRIALPLAAVERVIRAVGVTPLPRAPEIVRGAINMQGRAIPVLDIRGRFDLRAREPGVGDQMIIARAGRRPVALIADAVSGTLSVPQQAIAPMHTVMPGIRQIEGVVSLQDGLLFIHDLDRFLSIEEERELDAALVGT